MPFYTRSKVKMSKKKPSKMIYAGLFIVSVAYQQDTPLTG
jgi:hypothetical protein